MKRHRKLKPGVYMAVTSDEYELPIFFSEDINIVAEKFGVSVNTIYSSISLNRGGTRNGYKFVRVNF